MKKITLAHGSGGIVMHELIKDLFLKNFSNPLLNKLGDSAVLNIKKGKIAYTTDSYVINPIFFPGGDIGKLSICGTVNDLSVSGAIPKYMSCGMVVEEGFLYKDLEKIVLSMKNEAKKAKVSLVCGDFKVVEKGAIDKIFINTGGIGEVSSKANLSTDYIKSGDKVIINGTMGDHAASILISREELKFKGRFLSDCASLNSLIFSILNKDIKFMRDITRGGLTTTLNEISQAAKYDICIDENKVPIKRQVRLFSEAVGFDPYYMANEGKILLIVSNKNANKVLSLLKKHPLGKNASIIGEVKKEKNKKVYLKTKIGGMRILDMLREEQLPRIC